MERVSRERLAVAAALAVADTPEAPPPAHTIAAHCARWGLAVQLKPHQLQGVSWLIKCYIRGINVILGDEMGLGKTLQAITLLCYLKFDRGISGPFLILCPLSVIDGWSSEFLERAPKLEILRYIGNKEERAAISKEICNSINSQPPTSWEDPDLPFDVLLTTYDLAMADVAFLSHFRWRYGIIDEAQRLKNSSAVLYKTLESSYMIPRRLLLTGTPIQNNLTELWALLHFCMPQVFNNQEDFLMAFPVDDTHGSCKKGSGELNLLKSILNAFMLRRTKSALVQNKTLVLPPLSEVTILARLVPLQKSVYLSVLKKELPKLLERHGVATQTSLQNIVVQLRKACSHPYLFDGVEPEPYEEGEHLIQASGKLMILDSFLQQLSIKKHRVLVYAQMTRTLDILQDYLEFRGYLYERLDGSVRAEERFAAARKFNAESISPQNREGFAESSTPFVFLLTTRAGGVGLNLTAADTVIFYEQDWNPQADKQAVQRAHRIGQINPVLAINLVTENTVDEVILSRAKKKLKLTNDIIGGPILDPNNDVLDTAKPSDLHSMIIFGLDKLHSSTIESTSEDEVMPQMGQLVQEAMQQRGRKNGAWGNENLVSDQELEENLYTFEGQDFTPKRRKDFDEIDSHQPNEQAVLDTLIQKLENVSDEDFSGRRGRKRTVDNVRSLEEEHAAKQQKMELKRKAKWESLGYKSLAVHDPGEVLGDLQTEDDESKLHFVFGDCTKPFVHSNATAVIFSTVDDSGVWGSGGMFSALNKLSNLVQTAYEAAHTAGDLNVGDLHLLSLDGGDENTQVAETDQVKSRFWVALGVVQKFDRRRKIPRSDISLPALEACLRKVTSSAASTSASIHMPRISSRPGQDRKEWYAIERLLRKHANRSGVHIFVYYYKRPDKDE